MTRRQTKITKHQLETITARFQVSVFKYELNRYVMEKDEFLINLNTRKIIERKVRMTDEEYDSL